VGGAIILLHRYDTAQKAGPPASRARTIDVLHLVEPQDTQRFLDATRDERYRLDIQAFNVVLLAKSRLFSLKSMLPPVGPDGK
ncbi:sugar ABC transporter substrate-binding protein, partial [Pseudomonas syringae pv. actinidiae]|nr:sugar ABC transporter substrate-binding protein [Pseudomonas syringae pv. actinidiae]